MCDRRIFIKVYVNSSQGPSPVLNEGLKESYQVEGVMLIEAVYLRIIILPIHHLYVFHLLSPHDKFTHLFFFGNDTS